MKINFKEIYLAPNLISLFRLLLFIPTQYVFSSLNDSQYFEFYLISIIFIAFASDLLDGFIARKLNIITEFGKIIDPLSDKVLVLQYVLNLLLLNNLPLLYVVIVFTRDILIFLGGIYLSQRLNKVLPSNLLGKAAVFSIGVTIILSILAPGTLYFEWVMRISILFLFVSFAAYVLRGTESLKVRSNELDKK